MLLTNTMILEINSAFGMKESRFLNPDLLILLTI